MRFYPGLAPPDLDEPYITWTVISNNDGVHLTGADGLSKIIFQFDIWSKTIEDCVAIAEAVRNLLNGYQGGTWGTVTVESAARLSEGDDIQFPPDGSETGWRRINQELIVWHRET